MLHSEILSNLKHPKPKRDRCGKVVESRWTPIYYVTPTCTKTVGIELAPLCSKPTDYHNDARPRKRQRLPSDQTPARDDETEALGSTTATHHTSKSYPDTVITKESHIKRYEPDQLNEVLTDGSGDLNIPHVLISLALDGEQLLDTEAWSQWLKECLSFAEYARIEGMYKSRSTLLILSVPIVIWDVLPDIQACFFIGYVNSMNHVWQRFWKEQESLECLSINGETWGPLQWKSQVKQMPSSVSEAPSMTCRYWAFSLD
jgi:hypothetical protein